MTANPTLVRVFIIPPPDGQFCFGGGIPKAFTEVDWFHDTFGMMEGETGRSEIAEQIRKKVYFTPDLAYLVMSPVASFTLNYDASRGSDGDAFAKLFRQFKETESRLRYQLKGGAQ